MAVLNPEDMVIKIEIHCHTWHCYKNLFLKKVMGAKIR